MGLHHLETLLNKTVRSGKPFENGADEAESRYLGALASRPGTRRICEVGFNCGFSSWAFLQASPSVHVWSFDLADYEYSAAAKSHIDEIFPGRHTLVRGNSHVELPAFAAAHPHERFDVVFIDGDHSFDGATADLEHLRAMATVDTIVVMDDITPWLWFGEGPTQAWREAVETGLIIHSRYFQDGEPVIAVEPPADRAWAEGRYADPFIPPTP